MIRIDTERCKGCGLCMEVCPKKIIGKSGTRSSKGYYPAECTDNESCVSCAMCGVICPDCAITVERI